MAEAPGHRLGQIIGEALERAIEPVLQEFADEHGLYLDKAGNRPARAGKKVSWVDGLGNSHDLDFVLERGGSNEKIGVPVAFIETAWRRYTKHSRNKAQEIQGAVLPLLSRYGHVKPFAGVVLAGVFTSGSLAQLESNEFTVLYVPFKKMIEAFSGFGIDVEFDESTNDDHVRAQVRVYEAFDEDGKQEVADTIRQVVADQFEEFRVALESTVSRKVKLVHVIPLHGQAVQFEVLDEAIEAVRDYDASLGGILPFVRFDLVIRYTNGDRIEASFGAAADGIDFLESFRT